MNLLTKISIVLLLIVAVFGSIVFIQQAIVPASYKYAWEQQKQKSAMLEQNARYTALALARSEKEIGEIRAAFAQDSVNKQNIINDKISQIKTKELEVAEANRKVESFNINLTAAQKLQDGSEEARKLLETQLATLRNTLKETEERYRQAADGRKQDQAHLEREIRVNLALRQQIADQDAKIKDLESKIQVAQAGGKGAATPEEIAKPAGVLNGQIMAVNNNMASINIGTAHGVSVGQKLIIYRDDKFIGYLRVEEVFPSEAAGIVVDQQFEPQRGDKVTSSLK